MPCHICGADQADYACSSCKKEACYSHARTAGKVIMCVDCLKDTKPAKEEKNFFASAFSYALVLTIGLVLIFLVGEYAIFGLLESYSALLPDAVKDLITLFRGASIMILAGSAAITALLFLLGRLAKKKTQPQNAASQR
ncbi:MAG: hypothetical protein HY051_02685 [Candidatus Aenigmarchaeota archaeon]|nr:hypothetical protein [Candidatus Aenigmarchaeota archaeon]